ncbi:MAG: glycosyltransferase, partial [Verrucomicrobiaceae bacterium]|nr:glycosyltransferase [Verrucomicrobiaceae bacterium]
MPDDVVVITPEVQAGTGGLADYTLRVVEEWGTRARVRFLVPAQQDLRGGVPEDGGKLLLQYSAYGYNRLGYPRSLLRSLMEWRTATQEARLVVMLHEIWTFWPLLNKNRVIQHFHRADLRRLLCVADAVFTSTPSQAEHLRALAQTDSIQVLPVGSNVRVSSSPTAREEGLAAVFGLPAARLRALRSMQANLKSLAEAKIIHRVVTIGDKTGGEEQELLAGLQLAAGWEQRGSLPEAEVSHLLSRASFGISAQDELSLMKSGTFMAYAAHGLNILSPYADSLGPEPVCWLTHPDELLRRVSAEELD